MNKKFQTEVKIRFRDADPARIMYFANLISLAHDVFEEFIDQTPIGWKGWFKENPYMIPIRHVEADYKAPFLPGQSYQVEVRVASFGETSFKMKYVFTQGEKLHGTVLMVHSVLDKNLQKTPLPELFKKTLQPYLEKL